MKTFVHSPLTTRHSTLNTRNWPSGHDVNAPVHVNRRAGYAPRERRREIGAREADVHDIHQLAERRALHRFVEQQLEVLEPGRGARLERPRRDRVHANAFGTQLVDEAQHHIVGARAVGRIGDRGRRRGVFQAFDLGVGLHVSEEIACAGKGRRQNANGRTFGERAHDASGADTSTDIGRARDHGLDGFAGAASTDVFQHQGRAS